MAVELAEVAAGLPVAASFALAGGITTLREGRRRAALNEAMHELRRPLQVLSLALPADSSMATPVDSSLQLATVALDRLDREINGDSLDEAATEVSIGELIGEAARRWRNAVTLGGGSLTVESNDDGASVAGDSFALAQALDNLLSNAIEHGGPAITMRWRCDDGLVLISVHDAGAPTVAGTASGRVGSEKGHRRGHGLRVVRRVASRHGGSFDLRRGAQGSEAILRLPLCRRERER